MGERLECSFYQEETTRKPFQRLGRGAAGQRHLDRRRGLAESRAGKAECAVVKSNGLEGESPSGLAESRRSLERKN